MKLRARFSRWLLEDLQCRQQEPPRVVAFAADGPQHFGQLDHSGVQGADDDTLVALPFGESSFNQDTKHASMDATWLHDPSAGRATELCGLTGLLKETAWTGYSMHVPTAGRFRQRCLSSPIWHSSVLHIRLKVL